MEPNQTGTEVKESKQSAIETNISTPSTIISISDAVKNPKIDVAEISSLIQKQKNTESKRSEINALNTYDDTGLTVLHHAVSRKDAVELILLLLAHGANPTLLTKDKKEDNLLERATTLTDDTRLISFLLDTFPMQCVDAKLRMDGILDNISLNKKLDEKLKEPLQQRIRLVRALFTKTTSGQTIRVLYKTNPTMFINTVLAFLKLRDLSVDIKSVIEAHLQSAIRSQFEPKTEYSEEYKIDHQYEFDARTTDSLIIKEYFACGCDPKQLHLLELFQNRPQTFLKYMDFAIHSPDCYTRYADDLGKVLLEATGQTKSEGMKDKLHMQQITLLHNIYLQDIQKNYKYFVLACLEWKKIKNPKNLSKEENQFLLKNILGSRVYLAAMNHFELEKRIAKHQAIAEDKASDEKEHKEAPAQQLELQNLGWQELDKCMFQFLKHLIQLNLFWKETPNPNDEYGLFEQLALHKRLAESDQTQRIHYLSIMQAKIEKLIQPVHKPGLFLEYDCDATTLKILGSMVKVISHILNKMTTKPSPHR